MVVKDVTDVGTRGGTGHVATLRQWNENRHAIVNAAFAVSFASPPTPQTIRELRALHSKLSKAYPRKRETTGRLIGIQADAGDAEELHTEVGEPILAGITFDSLQADGQVERSITLKDAKLSITRGDYEGWDKTWGEVREIFELMLPVLLQRSDIIAFHLQYNDRFVWEGDRTAFRAEMLFRNGSQMLVPNIFETHDLWHSYHGYFEYPDQPHKHQLLNVAEVQVIPSENVGLDPDLGLVADIRLNHQTSHGVERAGGRAKPIKTVDEGLGTGGGTGLIDTYMNEMHEMDKWLLARLINDDMCAKIGLESPE